MLLSPTLDKLRELKFLGMVKELEEQLKSEAYSSFSFEERLGLLVEQEVLDRENRKLNSRLRQASLKQQACIEDIDFRHPRNLDKAVILNLANCKWIKEHHNILITGVTGVGKSYLGCALGHRACLEGFKVMYVRLSRLLSDLVVARGDGRYEKIMKNLAKVDLLIIDDWGLNKLNEQERRDFLEIMEDRYDLKSTIITSQVPVNKWHELIGDSTIADAILDRIVHNSYRIELKGESLRKKNELKNKKEKAKEKKEKPD
jgi:DNA replication protein DnaC